jgi:hypothetical protein
MAIIYSYPKVTSPLATDVLVLTDTTLTAGKRKNKTKSLAMSDLAAYVVSSTSGITGGGTLNTIPLWTPDGLKLGDSIIVQSTPQVGVEPTIQIGTYLGPGQQTVLGAGFVSTSGIGADQGSFTNITSGQTGVVTIRGNAIIGDASTDILQISSSVSDYTGTSSTAAGEILVSTANGQLVWAPAPSSGITGSGTLNTIPVWTPDGTKLGDSIITQAAAGQGVTVTGGLDVTDDLNVTGSTEVFGALTVNAKFTANDVDKHVPSVVYDADAGQVLKNEDSELAIGLGSVYPTSVNYPLWVQGRKNDDTARNICLQPVGGGVQIGVDNFNADKGSLATGYENEINGAFSFATGKTNVLGTSEATAAIGRLNEVTGLGSTAIGNNNTVTKKNTVVIGRDNTANNEDNFILGWANTTQKIQSTAIGRSNNLNSAKIVAVGHANTSSGTTDLATSFGSQNNSQYSNSHLFGMNLQSSQGKEVIIGKNNDTPSNPSGATTRGANVIIGVGAGSGAGANMNAVEYYGFTDGTMYVIYKALYNASSYANDTDAAAGGVPIGGLYRYNNDIKIRLT